MYKNYWGLKEKPFENTPDPRFLYRSQQHEEALVRLFYVVEERKGAGMLTGVFGCGKTLLAQTLLEEFEEGRYQIALIINPQLTHIELLRAICYQLGVKDNLSRKKTDLLHLLNDILINNMNDGKDTVIIIDEAHVIKNTIVFEELRLLLNFQMKDRFLLTLLLLGQPELREKINNIKQLDQRIAIKYYLDRFDQQDTQKYIAHRLKIAGSNKPIFTEASFKLVSEQSGGIPRRINHICDLSLLVGMNKRVDRIDERIIQEAAGGLKG